MRCPRCGNLDLDVYQRGYDGSKGCLGALFFGWIGLLWGYRGSRTEIFHCNVCGTEFTLVDD